MATKLFVGNLSHDADDAALFELFSQHGQVERAEVVTDRDTNQSRGFAFVEMASPDDAQAAIQALDGQEAFGRSLRVNEARPKGEHGNPASRGRADSRFIERFKPRHMPRGYVEAARRSKRARR